MPQGKYLEREMHICKLKTQSRHPECEHRIDMPRNFPSVCDEQGLDETHRERDN